MVAQIPSVATVSSRLDIIDMKMNELIASIGTNTDAIAGFAAVPDTDPLVESADTLSPQINGDPDVEDDAGLVGDAADNSTLADMQKDDIADLSVEFAK